MRGDIKSEHKSYLNNLCYINISYVNLGNISFVTLANKPCEIIIVRQGINVRGFRGNLHWLPTT